MSQRSRTIYREVRLWLRQARKSQRGAGFYRRLERLQRELSDPRSDRYLTGGELQWLMIKIAQVLEEFDRFNEDRDKERGLITDRDLDHGWPWGEW